MQQIPNPMANLYQSQLQASRRFADAVFNGTEKLDRLVLEATHRAVNDQLALAQAVAGGQVPTDAGLASSFMQRNSGDVVNYQVEMMRVVAEMQTEIGKSIQEYVVQVGTQAASAPQGAAKTSRGSTGAASTASTASDTTYNPMTTMFSFWETAFKEATAMAARNMEAVRSTARSATEGASSTARAATRAVNGAAEAARKAAEGSNGAGSRRRH